MSAEDLLQSHFLAVLNHQKLVELRQKYSEYIISDSEIINTLAQHTPRSKALSSIYLLKYRSENFALTNMEGYLWCLLNLKKYIGSRYIEKALHEVKEKIKIIIYQPIPEKEKSKILSKFNEIMLKFEYSNRYVEDLIDGLNTFNMYLIILENKTLQAKKSKLDKWKNCVEETMHCLLELKQINSDNFASLICDYLDNFINDNIKEEMLQYEMKSFTRELKNKFELTLISKIIEDIDKFIIRPCYYEDINYIQLEGVFKEIYMKHLSILKELKRVYFDTIRGYIPDFQVTISYFLRQFLKHGCTPDTKRYFNNAAEKQIPLMSLSGTISLLLNYPENVQYALAEVLSGYSKSPIYYSKFIFEEIQKRLHFHIISEEWAHDFINIVCNEPFVDKYRKIINENDLRLAITQETHNILIIDLTKGLCGMSTRNGGIILKKLKFSSGLKGAICQNYMHELGNFLIRYDCQTIKEHIKASSLTKSMGHETRKTVEEEIFGSVILTMKISASDYLIGGDLPNEIEAFRDRFRKLNDEDTLSRLNLQKSPNIIFLGECGFNRRRRLKIQKRNSEMKK